MLGLVEIRGGLEEMRLWRALLLVVLWVARVVEGEMRMALTSDSVKACLGRQGDLARVPYYRQHSYDSSSSLFNTVHLRLVRLVLKFIPTLD